MHGLLNVKNYLLHFTLVLPLVSIISVLFVAKHIPSSQCLLHDDVSPCYS